MLEWAVSPRERNIPVLAVQQEKTVHELGAREIQSMKRPERTVAGEERCILAAQRHVCEVEIIGIVLWSDYEHGRRRRDESRADRRFENAESLLG